MKENRKKLHSHSQLFGHGRTKTMISFNVITSIVWILGLLLAMIAPSHGYFCPTGCSCFQRDVRCMRARLNAIPRIPQDTALIDFRYNRFPTVSKNAFNGLSRVTTIFLNNNEISRIEDGTFDSLIALRFLYINNNHLTELPPNLFRFNQRLEGLYLENNEFHQIEASTFNNLPVLNRISLHNNKLTKLPLGAFTKLPSLKRLRLDGNPIDCDCSIHELWAHHQRHPRRSQISISLTCETPNELNRIGFSNLQERHFRCKKPDLLRGPHDMQIHRGDNVELPCQMYGEPEPEITWMQNTNEIRPQFKQQQQQQQLENQQHPHLEVLYTGSLKINNADLNDIGIYECIGRNSVGETKSQPIRMMVIDSEADTNRRNDNNNNNNNNKPHESDRNNENDIEVLPEFIHTPVDTIAALNGPAILLDCAAIGEPRPEIQWFFNGHHIGHSTDALRIQSNGSLMISGPITPIVSGIYRCEATNHLGTIEAEARIDVRELPEILVAPQNQTVNVGKPFILECDADGNPLPEISWQLNGTTIVANDRLALENENTELIVNAAREGDTGLYTCIAENVNGRIVAEAFVIVERANHLPEIIIPPFDLEAFTGTTIELPCKSDETDGIQITWRHDGRIIDPNVQLVERYQISGAGSLFVKNVTIRDGGRYECSLKNEFGRATASAVVTIKNTVDLAPGDRYVRIAFEEAAREIDIAINNTVDLLFSNRSNVSQNSPKNFADLLRVFRFPTGEARQLARAAEIYERTLVNIRKHILMGDNLTIASDKYEFRDLLSREHLHLVAELSGCMEHREMPNCTDMCYHSKYRSIDGTCNNLRNPTWGASLTAFRRIEKPIYENGFSMPIGWMKDKLYAGYPKPSSRLVSTKLISTKDITPDDTITHMVMQWGQFLDHDLDHAIPSVSSESWDGIDCKKTCEFAPPCYPIEVPPNDPRIKNRRCIDVVRSSSICGSGMTSVFFDSVQNREQINQLTSYIDSSQVYGYSYQFSQELRNLTTDEGLLRVGVHFPNQKDMLPFAAPQDGMDCRRNLDENTMSCFAAGDIRVNEQVGLLAMHTIWMREHNRIAVRLRDINPHWDGDTLYQEARKIVGAQAQHITYKHWLPLIIGESGMRMLGEYRGYNPNINPTIANEFATAALRFGHTIINPILHRLDTNFEPIPQGHLQLHKAFFAPWRIAYEGGVDPLIRGMFAVPAKLKTPDQNLNTELTEKLFLTAHAVALDLAAINIQRGRDHGLPGYNAYRRFCNQTVATTFDDLSTEIRDETVRSKLKELYGHPDNIDIWVGGILEDQVDGGKVGPLFQCLLVEQFRRLRDGDRFYYENPTVFQPEQLAQIKQGNLARILCDNGDHIAEITENVFILPKRQGGYKKCDDIPGINLYFWQDCGTCNSMPPLLNTYVPETYIKRRRSRRAAALLSPNNDHTNSAEHDNVPSKHFDMTNSESDSDLDIMFDINEERMSGLEEVIGSFQKELKKMHKKLRKLEESTGCAGEGVVKGEQIKVNIEPSSVKPKRSHCVDRKGTTRLNNEIWSPDVCTKCECRHGQVTCTHEKCGEIHCANGIEPIKSAELCCPICPTGSASSSTN